jgi:hypothetical protein
MLGINCDGALQPVVPLCPMTRRTGSLCKSMSQLMLGSWADTSVVGFGTAK